MFQKRKEMSNAVSTILLDVGYAIEEMRKNNNCFTDTQEKQGEENKLTCVYV